MADPELADEFSLEGRNDHEISVRHRASGHIYNFTINSAGLVPEPTTVPNTETTVVADSLKAAARQAALEYSRSEANDQPPPRPPPKPPTGWIGTDDASIQVVRQQAEAHRRRFIAAITAQPGSALPGSALPNTAFPVQPPVLPQTGGLQGVVARAEVGDLSSPPNIESIPPRASGDSQFTPESARLDLVSEPPTVAIIPPQASGGSQFRLDESGRIDLVPDPPDDTGPRQRELYDELRRQARGLSELGHNQLADLSVPIDKFLQALPENIAAVSVQLLWVRGRALRLRLDAHEIAVGSAEPSDPARLTLLVAAQLRGVVETFNVYIDREPKGRELEQARLGPQERDAKRAIVDAAEQIVEALRASPDVATPSTAQALTEQIEAAQDGSDQAVALAGNSLGNLVITLLRQGLAWLGRGAASDVKSGFYRGIGNAAAKCVISGGGVFALYYFIFRHAAALKDFVDVAFHDPALGRIIDAIVQAVSTMPPAGP